MTSHFFKNKPASLRARLGALVVGAAMMGVAAPTLATDLCALESTPQGQSTPQGHPAPWRALEEYRLTPKTRGALLGVRFRLGGLPSFDDGGTRPGPVKLKFDYTAPRKKAAFSYQPSPNAAIYVDYTARRFREEVKVGVDYRVTEKVSVKFQYALDDRGGAEGENTLDTRLVMRF